MLLKTNIYFYLYLNPFFKKQKNFNFIVYIIYLRIFLVIFILFKNPNLLLDFLIQTKIIGVAHCMGPFDDDIIGYAENLYGNRPSYRDLKYELTKEKIQITGHLSNLKLNCEKNLNYDFEYNLDKSLIKKNIYHSHLEKKIKSLDFDYYYTNERSFGQIRLSKSFSLIKYMDYLDFKIEKLGELKDDSTECCIKSDIKMSLDIKTSCLTNCSKFHSYCFSEINETIFELNKLQTINNKFSFLPKKIYFFVKKY